MIAHMKERNQVRFINPDGTGLVMMNTSPLHIHFILQRIEGIGGVEANINSQKSPYQDGSTFLSANLEPRDITLRATINARSREELFEYREYVQRVFYPSYGEGVLIVQQGNKSRLAHAVAETTPVFFDYIGNQVSFVVNLVAHDPFWYRTGGGANVFSQQAKIQIVDVQGFYGEDLRNLPTKGTSAFSDNITMGRTVRTINNPGTAQSPFKLIIPSVDDFIFMKRRTGEKIELSKPLLEGESLVVETAFGNRKVSLIKEDGSIVNGFDYLTRGSSFFYLDGGDNRMEFNRSYDNAGTERGGSIRPRLIWEPRYVGI